MPTVQTVESGLRQATERFASELATPGASEPAWTDFDWTMARAAAVLHGVAPLLSARLRWRGPAGWHQFAESQFTHTCARQHRMERELARIDAACRSAGIGCIPLKGSALHAMGLYRAGERPMADIDLLVHERAGAAMTALLRALSYQPTHATWKHQLFEPHPAVPRTATHEARMPAFGEHRRAPIKIELHTRVSERLPIEHRDITAWVLPPELCAGLNPYPSSLALLLHLLLHAAGNMMAHGLRLIHLHDIALLAAELRPEDWQRLRDARLPDAHRREQPLYWALPPLALAQRYFAGCVPDGVLEGLRASCPKGLQRRSRTQSLSDVSLARLSIPLLPELGWSTSLAEKLRCLGRRLRPGPEERAVDASVGAEAWSRGRPPRRWVRVLRRLLLGTPRQSSMYVVRAALAAPTATSATSATHAAAAGPQRAAGGAAATL